MTISLRLSDELQRAAEPYITQLCNHRFASRLLARDSSLWGEEVVSQARDRLGWVDPFSESFEIARDAIALRESLLTQSIGNVVLCGMGGSSLGPEVIARDHAVGLAVLDTTHPAEIRRALSQDLAHTAVVVSSKSGSTVETISQFQAFRSAFEEKGLDPKRHIVLVTDPGSQLSDHGSRGYRVFHADPSVGGRFSVLTAFGVVPSALAGADILRVLEDAKNARELLFSDDTENPALQLAAALYAGLPERFVMLMEGTSQPAGGMADWVEQLIAESTGKVGLGLLPISLPPRAPELQTIPSNSLTLSRATQYAPDRDISLAAELGEEFYLWEVATVAVGHLMGINPFDQPDVEFAKVAARASLRENPGLHESHDALSESQLTDALASLIPARNYIAIQAFIDRESDAAERARELREKLARSLGVPVSLGWGPRYLHSTGQFHKGGPELGIFVQLIDEQYNDLAIPGEASSFGQLIRAQASGDREVLEQRGNPVFTRFV